MPKETPNAPAPAAPAADLSADDGWSIESHSAPSDPAPSDTTAGAVAAPAAAVPADTATPPDAVNDDDLGADEVSRSAPAPASDDPAKPAVAEGKKKKGPTVPQRKEALTRDIDRLTYQKHTVAKEIETETQRLARIRGEIAALEGKGKAPADASTAPGTEKKPAAAAMPPEMPAHPKYSDFETDAQYEEAVGKWRQDVARWQTALTTSLKNEIASGLDTRLSSERQEAAAQAARDALVQKIETIASAHDDWEERREVFREVRSSWSRDEKVPTPFLSDVVQNTETGAEVLEWLLYHPDDAQVLADLHPSRAMRDAVILSSSPKALFEYFATAEGSKAFNELNGMHPGRLYQAVGALSARVAAASSGPGVTAPAPITAAVPSAKPPAGSPRARSETPASGAPNETFEQMMERMDAEELAQKRRLLGLTA